MLARAGLMLAPRRPCTFPLKGALHHALDGDGDVASLWKKKNACGRDNQSTGKGASLNPDFLVPIRQQQGDASIAFRLAEIMWRREQRRAVRATSRPL